jgi:hypothetical protein
MYSEKKQKTQRQIPLANVILVLTSLEAKDDGLNAT